ncbi:MAG: leucine-rich repeat protein, partial [Clostridia bacterium]|nr:leucine-rich repeat protein [Clostridia bacterium]
LSTATQQWYRNPTTGNEVEATYYIPSALKNVTVTGGDILYGAFYNCRTLRQITLSDEVGFIESGAFIGCSSLQYNEYENGLYLGNETNPYLLLVQAQSTDITTCEVNRQTKFIHEGAFFGCKALKNLVIPDSVTDIGDNLLRDCLVLEFNEYDNAYYLGNAENPCVILVKAKDTNITSCSVNEKTRFIYKEAFQFCSELTELSIPESVLGIGSSAFSGCVKLKNVNIPTKCKEIKQYTFSNCGLIEDIVIPDSVETIEKGAFFNCDSLMSVTFGKNVTMIGEEAFQECAFLTTVTLNPKVMKIGDNAFKWCARLASITIPITVKEIGAYAFRYCNNFTDVIYEGTKEQWKTFRKENDWDSDTGSYTVHCKDGDLSK